MRDYKNFQNINMFLSSIDKMNPYFKNASNNRKNSKQKEFTNKKMNQTEDYSNQNLSKKENNSEYNLIYQITNNDINNQSLITKKKQNNFAHKRSLSKNIFNNINNYNTFNKNE